jgi:TRAP-type C4-dicarboxylate transport system substrate-binding protein
VYPSGVLTPPAQSLDAVKTGVADMVHNSPNFAVGMTPTIEALGIPLPAQSSWVLLQAGADFASHFQMQGLKEFTGTHFLSYCGPVGPYYIMTAKKPVKTLEDLKGLRIRSGGVTADMVTAWGASPINVPTSEVYESLSKGVFDGGILGGETLNGFKLAEVVNYITVTPFYVYGPSMLLMNLDRWNSLPADIQQVFTDTIKEFNDWEGKVWWYSDIQGMDYYRSMPGKQVYTIPAAEAAKWDASIQPVIDKYVTTYSKLGLPTADYVKYAKERCDYWNGKQPDKQSSMDWVKKEITKQ